MSKIKLFFIPHAGGSAMGYLVMKRYLDVTKIEPVPLELAGRGQRIKESCYTDITSCIKDLYQNLKPQIAEGDYAIFGHSLGALLSYELVQYVRKKGDKLPVCIFFSGRIAPDADFPVSGISAIEDEDEFLSQFGLFQPLPKEMLENKQITKLMLPILRADVTMAEEYQYQKEKPLTQDIYIFHGENDILLTSEGIEAWNHATTKQTTIVPFPGDHFYFKENPKMVMERVNEVLLHYS
ncbi:MAG: thioesterase [Clostridium sp.]|mgnify:CR=1 FL=1|nr:thioesterase [Clostridium sp.]